MRTITLISFTLIFGLGCDSRSTLPQDVSVEADGAPPVDGGRDLSPSDSSGDIVAPDISIGDLSGVDGLTDAAKVSSCDPALAACWSLPPSCPTGKIASVVDSCWGPCVDVASCIDLPLRPNCDLSNVMCEMVEPTCLEGYFPTAVGYCYGPCVPAGACACTGAGTVDQCPLPDMVCWTIGFCGPLI